MSEFLVNLREAGPLVVFTLLVLVGAAREWWVWGHTYRRERAEKEYWRDKFFNVLGMAEKSVEVASDVIIEEVA